MGVKIHDPHSMLNINYWLEPDNLVLLEGWARDGLTIQDIADRIGINAGTLRDWMNKQEDIGYAINSGRELVDYKVENALLKAALGYRTKEVKITTTMRGGKVVEKIKEVTTSEAAPNVAACKAWLYNRKPKQWKAESARANLLDDFGGDTDVRIVIERAGNKEGQSVPSTTVEKVSPEEVDPDWVGWEDEDNNRDVTSEVNDAVVIRSATPEEQQQARKEQAKAKRAEARKKLASRKNTEVVYEPGDKDRREPKRHKQRAQSTAIDVDAWPDDWEDGEED